MCHIPEDSNIILGFLNSAQKWKGQQKDNEEQSD
jgi:hypothetical protein